MFSKCLCEIRQANTWAASHFCVQASDSSILGHGTLVPHGVAIKGEAKSVAFFCFFCTIIVFYALAQV